MKNAKLATIIIALLKIAHLNLSDIEQHIESDYNFCAKCDFEDMFEILNLTKKYEPINLIEVGLSEWCDDYNITADNQKNFLDKHEMKIRAVVQLEGLNKIQAWRKLKLPVSYYSFVEFCRNRKIGMMVG